MIAAKRVLAIIPARAGSKGLPNKNIRPLGGKPLLAWPIEAARGSTYVDRTIVSTDSQSYAEVAAQHGADVPFIRPAELASDSAPSIGFLLHALDTLEADGDNYHYVVLLEPTSPLTESRDIDAALERLDHSAGHAAALVGMTPMVTTHPAYAMRAQPDGLVRPLIGSDFAAMPRRQDLEPLFCLDGSLYISTVEALRRERAFCHSQTIGFATERHKAMEVDDLVDFICIEAVLRHRDVIASGDKPHQD